MKMETFLAAYPMSQLVGDQFYPLRLKGTKDILRGYNLKKSLMRAAYLSFYLSVHYVDNTFCQNSGRDGININLCQLEKS